MVDAVVREWLRQALGEEAAKNGVAEMARTFIVLFYVDDGYIASRDPVFLQTCLDILVGIFERVGLFTNVKKTKAMTCLPGKIRYSLSEESYRKRFLPKEEEEEEETEILEEKVECEICHKKLKPASLRKHLERKHNIYRSKVIDQDLFVEREPQEYTCELFEDGLCCPVESCEYCTTDKFSMRRHFWSRHRHDTVCIPSEAPLPYPKCEKCGMQVGMFSEDEWKRHWKTKACIKMTKTRQQREAVEKVASAMDVKFTAYGEELEGVDLFKYLGKLTSFDDNDIQAIRSNLKKARKTWARLSHVCRSENIPPKIAALFYMAVIQSVLLFGSEAWCLNKTILKELEGFHITAAYRMAKVHRPRKDGNGEWKYPRSEDVLDEVGLLTIEEYIEKRRNKVAEYVALRPVYEFCVGERRRQGTHHTKTFWWNQLS